MQILDCIIVGAGISGITASRVLMRSGLKTVVLEKSRGPGGRATTRRFDEIEANADHGAPSFHLSERLIHEEWSNALKTLPLVPSLSSLPQTYWIKGGINQLPKVLAKDLDIRLNETVLTANRSDGIWKVSTASGQEFLGRNLLVTIPLPQAANILSTHPELSDNLSTLARQVDYIPRWTFFAMTKSEGPIEESTLQHRSYDHPVIASIHTNRFGSDNLGWDIRVIQTSEKFSVDFVNENRELVSEKVCQAMMSLLNLEKPENFLAHRWLYAFVRKPLAQAFWQDKNVQNLLLAGDFTLGSTLELAALSGYRAAEHLISHATK